MCIRSPYAPGAMDEQLRGLLDEGVNLVQLTVQVRSKVIDAGSATGGRHLDGSAQGCLDGAALREVLDRMFGEHDPTLQRMMGIPNWVHACDFVPCGLYKHLNTNPETSDKVEVRWGAARPLATRAQHSFLDTRSTLFTPRHTRSSTA